MNRSTEQSPDIRMEQVSDSTNHEFLLPSKRINDTDDLHFFLRSFAYRDLSKWLYQLNRAVFPVRKPDGSIVTFSIGSIEPLPHAIQSLRSMLDDLSDLIEQAPPDTGARRFGNVAFRKWYQLAEGNATDLIERHLSFVLDKCSGRANLTNELRVYLLGAFGSAQRLDYGTGHELSFIAFLGCLWKLAAFKIGEEPAIVLAVIQPYLTLVRKLIQTYTLEPAGSHGVWGLDDHSFVPYIFGSAQFGPAIDPSENPPIPTEGSLKPEPTPASVTSRPTVAEYKHLNMYFSAINFIYEVKKGPFWEHSPVLYDVSGIKDGWAKINKGMMKMYDAEVLGKFPVIQHFPFGSLFAWESDMDANTTLSSVHAQSLPAPMQGQDVPHVPRGHTAAPRTARPGAGGTSVPYTQAHGGVPSTRAPWTGAATNRPAAPPAPISRAPAPRERNDTGRSGTQQHPPSTTTGGMKPPGS